MPIPLIAAAVAGTVARTAGTRMAAGALAGEAGGAAGTGAAAGRALNFGGRALQHQAGRQAVQQRQERQAPPQRPGFMQSLAQPTMGHVANQQFSGMLQPGQFVVRQPGT